MINNNNKPKKLTKPEKKLLRQLKTAERIKKNFCKKKRTPEEEKERFSKYHGPRPKGGRDRKLGWKTFYWFEERGRQLIKTVIDYTKTDPKPEAKIVGIKPVKQHIKQSR